MAEIQPCPHGVPQPWICTECGDTHWSPEEARRAAHVAELFALVNGNWPAFWRSLPPREAWEAAKAMPKIAGAWEAQGGTFVRSTFLGVELCWWACGELFEQGLLRSGDVTYCGKRLIGTYPDRASADAALRAADWILVDEEGAT